MPDNRYYYFKDAKGNRHTVNKAAFDNDREGFAKAFPGARMEVIDRKTGRRGDVDVKDAGRVGDFGAHLFTGQTVRREKYQPKTSLGKAALRVAQKKWGGADEAVGAKPNYASLGLTKPVGNKPHGASVGLSEPLVEGGKESALVKGLREADALKRRDEEQMPIDYTKPSAVKQMVGRTHREQQALDRRIEQAGREAGKEVMKPLREKEARLKTPVVDTGDANVNAHVINTQEQAERQLVESGLEFANKHLDDYVSDNILNEFKTATAKGAAAESVLSKASPFAYMAAGKAYNEALDPDKLLKHLQEKANADIAKVLSQPKMQEEIGLKAAAYGISPEEYVEKSLIPGLQAKLAADFDNSELSRSMPKSTAEYILRGVNESMLGTIMSMGMTSKKQRQYAQQGMAMTDNGENPDVNPGMAARVARGTLGFVADAPVFGAAGKAGAAVAGKVFGNGVAQTARIANSTLGGRIARMAGSGMVSQGITGVLYGSTNAAVQNYSTGDDTSIGNTVKVMAMGGLSEGASWATMGGIGGAVGAGIYNVSGVKRIPAKAFQLAMEGIGMHIGGNVAKTIEGHDTDWTSIEGNLEACANVVALKLTHARLPKRQSKDGIKESYLDMVARNINGLMTSDGQRAAFGGYTFTNKEKEQLFGSASAPKRNESIYGYDAHNNPLTRKESLTSWAMRAKKTAVKGKGEESYKDTDAEFVKTAYDEIMADNTIPWDTKAKFSALVMGTVPSARPMMENCRIEGGSVNEYSKNGELLSKNSFKSIDERNSIIYSLNMKREDQRLSNAYGAAQIKDEKTAQATLEAVAEANGMTAEQLKAAMDKQPLRRSDEEQNACVALRKAYEDEQFVPGTLHAEQSNTEGKDVVEENGLGTETPNNEAASEVLGDLTKTEDALQAAMDSNDVLKEEYERMQKAGMSNPQIYMELFNSGLTQEQLAPLADYINALSKAQGMFKGTQDKIVEATQKHVGQWSYKGELNGEKQNGEQMVFVKDDKGRVLIVGAGDVAFDGEGRVRDGDMLTVYDPATREMDFVHAKDVTLERTASSEEYAKDYQRQLEELNSEVYAAMQQDSKPNEASLSQTKPGEQPVGEEGNEALLDLTKPTEPVGEKETTPVGEEPVATLADGTPVPMMKDSKGRETADYSQMSPEQGAEWMSSQFGENAEAAVDGQIKRAEKTLKDAEKIKVDYTGDLNDAKEAEAQKKIAIEAAKAELELYTNIKKAMTEKKVKAGMEKVSSVGGVGEVGSVGSVGVAREKFESGLRVVGNKRTRTLADGTKLKGHYEIVEADSLTPSHNANDGYKKSEGFPVNEEGRTINDRDYENDKQAQLVTDMIAMKYDGQAVDQVPVVTSDGIVVDGNGRTMAGQKAAKNGTDSAYIEALKENAENYGFTAEQIEQSGIKHPRLVLVSDEPMKYDTATFAKFNKNEKKAQGNTQQAVANSKKLSTDEIGTIISEIEGSGSLDAFFNNPSAINSLLTRLVDKGVIGLNEVAGLREGEDKLSAAGKDFVKNLLLGSVFSENTIRMMGADAMLKTKALNGIRAVTDNMKLGDYALMKEIDKAVQLLYEARQGGSGVDAYLRTPAMFGENAADRFDPISQAIALALEGKVEDFRELMMAYNRNAAPYADANQTEMFGERPTKEDFVNEFLKLRNWEDYETRHSSKEGNGDAGSSEGTEPQARGGSEPTEEQREVDKAVKRIATEITKKTGIEVVTDEKEAEEVIRESEETDSNLKYHKETDEATLEELENGETVKVYRAMQVIDGKLYPPMAAAVNGKRVEANELGTWIRADENPDLAIPDIDPKTKEQKVDKKTGELKWKFKLDKGGKDATGKKATDIPAAYNPYWHTSRSPLNDQFKSAWIRPNIVVVECEVPVSELSSGYRAERAKDAVGEVDWKSGVVSGEVYKQTGRARKVILSRWCKPVRVLSDAEVAQRAKEFVGDAKVEIPENVLTPRQRIEFEKAGFKIGAPEKGVKKSDQILEALKRGLQIDNEIKEHRSRWAGGEVVGMKQLPDKLHTDPDMLWNEISQYHGDYITRKLEKVPEDGTVKFFSAHDGKWYFYSVDKNHTITLFDAVEASRENYELFKDKLKKYGFDGTTKAVRDGMQEAGYTGRTDGDKFESFIRPGIERSNGLGDGKAQGGRRADRRGMAGEDDGTQLEGNSEKQGEVKYFRTANGEVYGFTDGEKIYLDTKKMKPETPLHEYAHLWCDMLRKVNPKEWENVKKLFDKVEGLKEEVQKLYPELEGDALYEEMITTYSGREGTKKLEDVVRKLAAEDGKSVTESAKAQGFLKKVKEALTKYWKGVADVLGIHFTTAEEVADKVLADWAKGVDPRGSKKANGEGGNKPDYAALSLSEPVDKGGNETLQGLTELKGEEVAILPKKEENTLNPIVKAAENYKKDHPLTEGEIRSSDVDDIAKDMAVDYLNGEVTDDLHRAVYESIYEKVKDAKMKNTTKQADDKTEATEAPKVEASASPIEGMKNAAEKFAKEKEAATEAMGEENKPQQKADDAAVEASNKKVNDLWNDLLKAGREDLSASFIGLNARQLEVLPKLVSAMAENAYLRIKRGMHNLEDVVKEMRKEFAPAAKVFKKEDVDAIYEQMMNIRYRDGEQRMSLKEWADYYEKSSPKHKEELVGDSKTAEERKQAEKKFIDAVKLQLAFGRKIKSIIELRKIAERHGLKDIKDTDLQELAEVAIVMKARGIASSESTNDAVKFERIKKLYENQPSLNQRDSERVMKQQYSTPAPYAFLADMYVKAGMEVKSALEPSAGNGMLTIGLPKDAVHVNDIDAQRLANLQRQGFKNVTSQDGTQPFADKDVDVVVTNPPFGSATPRDYDGYTISSLEGQMAINALESMKDNGRAAIIIGGKTEYAKNGSLNPKDKALLGYLYSHYKVEDVINVDGSLYAKQGTTYPTRIILINGRRFDENAYPPVKDKARAEAVKSYDELYKRINDDILQSGRMDSPVGEGGEDANAKPNRPSVADANEEGVRAGGNGGGEQKPSVRTGGVHDKTAEPVSDNVLGTEGGTKPGENGGLPDGATGANGAGTDVTQSEWAGNNPNTEGGNVQKSGGNVQKSGGNVQKSGGNGRPNTQPNADGVTNTGNGGGSRGQLERLDRPVRELSAEKVTYAPRSENPFTLKAVMPADQQESVNKNLEKLGDADQFLVDELGYNDKADLYAHLAAEQVDSVALALQQAKKGNAFIIGDMTGIGKGRQAASLIRYAKKQGQVPVYFTKTAGLLSDVYRDLVDIGSKELRPFVFGSAKEAAITDADGNVVFALPSKNEVKRVLDYIEKNGELPKEYDYVLTTYSQVSNGVYEFDENGNRKERKLAKGKKFGAAAISGQARRDAIEKLMKNGYLILDESHTAGGDSGQGNYFQHIIQKAKNVTFFSATFAKRPDNMPIYALRTAMNQGGLKASDLIDAVKRGGATLQEIMSQALTQCGQMIRRERDMTGVTIDWKAIDDPEVVAEQREQYDSIIGLFNDIINFQRTYVSAYVDRRNEELAEVQSSMGIKRGTEALGIKNQPFASKAFNTVQQVLLSLKAKSAAERAIEYLKQGMKPVIALNNTNESQTGNLALGEEMDAPDLGTSLKKGLEGTLRYTSKNAKDESESGYINLSDLGADAVEAYHALEEKIRKTSTGLSLSPIDVIKNELTKAGYKVGELTGRQTEFVYNENGTVTKVKRADTDKKKLAREFNDGQIDALILNKSAATGISLHASSKYADQRKRVMIVAQQQLDVNDEVQMRGRIDRTGQVARGAYEYVVSLIPAEQRLLMMFKAKLKSLDANTTSSQKSKFNEMEVADITNKYGDKVVKEYMAEHLDLYARMADPFGWEKSYGADLSTIDPQKLVSSSDGMSSEAGGDASKLLGRMALLKVKEQEKMLQEIGDLYAAEIQRLNEMGENDLEITELPLKAKTINKGVWKEGSEPGGDNAFADNTYVEKVNMAVLKKPMKAEEVKKAQDGLTGGKSWDEYRKEKITAAKEYFDKKTAEATQKYEERAVKAATKAKEKYIKEAKKGQKENGMSDEQIEKMAGYQYESIYSDEKTKLDEVVKNLKAKYGVFERALETFNTEDAFVLPTDMNNPAELSGFGNSYGRLIDIKITDNFSTNASTISFATLDGRRKITFPINGKVGLGSDKADVIGIIDRLTRQASAMGDKHLRVLSMDASNWDKLTSNESRKDGYIITGNLLQALIDTKEQGLGGQLVKYTTDTGEVKTGILMPEKFEPNGLANEKPINSVAEKFELPTNKGGITEITSSDEDVKIAQGFDYMKMARNYTIRVPKSNKKGGKYFLDKELLKMVDGGNFETRGNTMLAEIKADKLKDVLDRLSELGVKVREESGVHYRTEHGDASLGLSKPLEGRIAETVEKVSKQTGGKVKMVNSVEEIGNEQVRRDIENGKQVTGWYDENTGEVHLYMPNIHDSYTAEKTVWHETVGHEGMRGLLGDKFNDYMRGLWMDLDNPVNAELRAYVKERMSKDSMGFYDAIEEFIAESAEKGKGEPGFWNYIKNKVTDALHEIGYRISPNVKDVKYMLWLAKNVQKKGDDPWWKMRADAVKWKIEHENVEYTKIHGGEFYENDGKNHDFEDMTKEEWDEATDGQIHYRTAPSAATALDRYHSMLNAHGYMATEAFMDNMLSLEKLMKAVDPSIKKIEDVKISMNPYILQNTMQGAMSDKMTLFEHQVMKPLDKAMSDVLDSFAGKNTEEKIRECNLYMIGKHGLERNRVLFVRDWFRKMEKTEDVDDAGLDNLDKIWKGERSDLRRKLDSGQIDLREYYRQMDEWIVQNIDKDFKAEEHDYSGMHGLQEIDDLKSPYDDAGAIDSVMSQEAKMENQKKGSVDNLWNRIKDATNYSINSDYENGLMSEELRDRVASMFDWYVPLRKFDEATAEDVYGYISGEDGKGFIGETLMNAKGRKSLSDVNVLAQIGAMANRAIRNGGQNAVKQAFARFVRNSGMQNLVKETKVWVEKTGTDANGNDIWEEAYPQIPDNANAHDVATIVDAFETDMKTKQAKGEAKTLSNSTDIGFKFARAKNKSEHFVDVKIAGRTHRFVVLGNPRAAQALNGMLENSSPKSALLKGLKSTTRFMAQMATSYSPEFVMRNIIRDAEFASSNVTAKEGVRYGLKWARYYAELNPLNIFYNEGAGALKNLKWKDLKEGVGIGLYARYREGTLGDSKMERYFKEFMQNGGETGWVQVKTMQEWEKEYKRDVSRERSNVSKAGKMLRDVLVGNVENLNEMAENMARFATFCTSRDLGRSAVRSAYDAKQVSTNFNRHGSGDAIKTFKNGEMGAGKEMRRNVYGFIASYLRNYSMFFNAGVQSTHLLMNNVKKAPVGTIASMMAMPFGLGILAAAVNNAMIANEDEKERKGVKDPYGELPEYIRRNNLCIYKGGGKFVTIPLAIELRAFYGLGDIAAGMTTAKNVKSTRDVAMDAVGCMSQLLPVVDFTNTSAFDKEPGKETLKGVLPTAAAPFVEWWLNSDWKGAPIRREGDYTENRPAWMNAYSGTPEKLMDLNKWVNARTNDVAPGNENMRGNSLLDEATDPAMLNHIIGTIGGGAATFMTRGTGLVLKYADGREQEIETKDIPFLRSLMYTPSEQTSMARTKAKWYSYKESMEKNMSNYSMLKNKNVPLTERIRNAADRHRFEQGADYARIRIIKDAEKQMKRWNKMKRLNADDKKQVDFANKNIEMIMQKAVEQMDGISEE
nr:MAG TPA: notch-like protein [Caudoviricetes sp.]